MPTEDGGVTAMGTEDTYGDGLSRRRFLAGGIRPASGGVRGDGAGRSLPATGHNSMLGTAALAALGALAARRIRVMR